ncbi:MAG TPA: MFS transporter [Candidatus Paceibacterota bacterium]|nr:MFS transporter [Candidatus Paceibacterota bacterium]
MRTVSKPIILLGIALFFIFLGFNATQQFVTPFFEQRGIVEVGFQSLILIYVFFVFTNPFAATIAVKYGPKVLVAGGSLAYSLYIASLASGSLPFIYAASAVLGVGAGFFWMGENSYLFRTSKEDERGKNVGFIDTLLYLGTASGVLGVGFLVSSVSFRWMFLFLAFMPLIGFLVLLRLPRLHIEQSGENRFVLLRKAVQSTAAIRIAGIWLAMFMVMGLVIGILPVQIAKKFDLVYVGVLTSLPFLLPVFLSYGLGRISDRVGRKKVIAVAYALVVAGMVVLQFSDIPVLLVIGSVLLALAWTLTRIGILPLIGDIGSGKNLEALIALFWMSQNAGVILALLLGRFLNENIGFLYGIALAVVLLSFAVAFPLFRTSIGDVRKRLGEEIA